MTAPHARHVDTDFGVPVHIMVPASLYRRFVVAAEKHHTDVGALIVVALRSTVQVEREPVEVPRRQRRLTYDDLDLIRELNREGWNDALIGRKIGHPYSTVAAARRRMGLPARVNGRPKQVTW